MEVVGEETIIRSSMSEPINVEPISIVKGKRTKRQRALSPVSTFPLMITTTTTSSSSGGGGDGGGGGGEERGEHEADHILTSATTTTTSFEFLGESTEEEEDMANCLILLAQGYSPAKRYKDSGGGGGGGDAIMEKFISRRFTEAATTTNGKAGFYVYECKTCNRCFPSFQALGGHRASHKKPKALEKKALMLLDDDHNTQFNGPSLSLQMSSRGMFSTSTNNNNNKSKVHECSICGSEFSSGQALGGHMRRHRTTNTTTTTITNTTTMEVSEAHNNNEISTTNNKTKSVLSLDLNLPAPEQDDRAETKFPFNSKLFSASSSLVDCHY